MSASVCVREGVPRERRDHRSKQGNNAGNSWQQQQEKQQQQQQPPLRQWQQQQQMLMAVAAVAAAVAAEAAAAAAAAAAASLKILPYHHTMTTYDTQMVLPMTPLSLSRQQNAEHTLCILVS